MPERNTRVVVLGTPKADKQFDVFDIERAKAQREGKQLARDAERLRRKLKRARAQARRDVRRGR